MVWIGACNWALKMIIVISLFKKLTKCKPIFLSKYFFKWIIKCDHKWAIMKTVPSMACVQEQKTCTCIALKKTFFYFCEGYSFVEMNLRLQSIVPEPWWLSWRELLMLISLRLCLCSFQYKQLENVVIFEFE